MNNTQHTPGPWEHKGNRVYRKDSYEVAWIAGQGPHSEWQANATLIAAAPAMYEALKIASWLSSECDCHEPWNASEGQACGRCTAEQAIKQALAQAEGR